MKIHSIAVNLVGIVNPNQIIILRKYDSTIQNAHYEKEKIYIDSEVKAQVQAISSSQLKVLEHLNIQGESHSLITKAEIRAISQPDKYDGDIVIIKEQEFLVVSISETFHDHTQAIVVKQ